MRDGPSLGLFPGMSEHATSNGPSDGMWRERWTRRWARRAVTIPGVFLVTALHGAVLPLLLAYALVADLVRRQPLLLCRFHLTIFGTLVLHCVGLISVLLWWLAKLVVRPDQRRWRAWHAWLECWWADKLIGVARALYGLRVVVEDGHLLRPGPALLLLRHASIVDTMLPAAYIGRGKVVLRIVKKRELLWDPCVDLVGTRLPRAYVRRGAANVRSELERLRTLSDGMGADDAIALFPEGTRFTTEKQAQVLARLKSKDPAKAARAARLRHVLPVRPAGTTAILDHRPDLDLVFCAHTGLEGASRLDDFVRGALLGRVWRVKLWRVPSQQIPRDPAQRLELIERMWEKVDTWIDEHRQYGAPRRRWISARRRAARQLKRMA